MLQYSITTDRTQPGMYMSGGGDHNRTENAAASESQTTYI